VSHSLHLSTLIHFLVALSDVVLLRETRIELCGLLGVEPGDILAQDGTEETGADAVSLTMACQLPEGDLHVAHNDNG
jgi:hypothetical protein